MNGIRPALKEKCEGRDINITEEWQKHESLLLSEKTNMGGHTCCDDVLEKAKH